MSTINKLVIVGSGIKFMSHLTIEVKAHIEQADKVLYLINRTCNAGLWIVKNSKALRSSR